MAEFHGQAAETHHGSLVFLKSLANQIDPLSGKQRRLKGVYRKQPDELIE
jgi:hypothetical protein